MDVTKRLDTLEAAAGSPEEITYEQFHDFLEIPVPWLYRRTENSRYEFVPDSVIATLAPLCQKLTGRNLVSGMCTTGYVPRSLERAERALSVHDKTREEARSAHA